MSDPRLKSLIERIERLIEERKALSGDIRDIFTEAKSAGYVPKAMRKVIARRAMDASDLAEEDALVEAYEEAAGAAGVAAKMVAAGATIDEAAAATGIPRSTVGFLKPHTKIQVSENLDETESCGGVESRHARAAKDRSSRPDRNLSPVATAGVAPGPQDIDLTIPAHLDRRTA